MGQKQANETAIVLQWLYKCVAGDLLGYVLYIGCAAFLAGGDLFLDIQCRTAVMLWHTSEPGKHLILAQYIMYCRGHGNPVAHLAAPGRRSGHAAMGKQYMGMT